jgi:hypothetical protein
MYKKLGLGATAITVLMLTASAIMKLKGGPELSEGFRHLGMPEDLRIGLGILELTVVAIYLFPRTSVLGAILITGYLGGAICTHLRVGDPFLGPLVPGVLAWAGLWLRDPRLADLIPLKK